MVRHNTLFTAAAPAITTFNGGTHLFGNTEERLKHKVLGVPRRRGVPSSGPYNHREGTGYVPYHRGDYHDAIENGKSRVRLLVHEATFGGMSPYAASRLRRLGRLAAARGTDCKIDYTRSYTASSFVPYFAQRLSTACVVYGAAGILDALKTARADRLRAA